MKLMFASDLHGSLFFCNKLINAYQNEKPQKLILLGDLLYHGPRNDLSKNYNTIEVAKLLNSIKNNLLCVHGNCDAEVDQMVLDFPIMSDYSIMYIENRLIFFTHGHIYNKNNLPKLNKNDIIICGHTHVQTIENINGIIYINPGSVSLPKQNNPNTYMIYENKTFKIKDFSSNIINQYNLI